MKVDDGWIFRGARTYRGALQAEDEEAGARALVLAMLDDPAWLTAPRFARLREAVRLLPLPRADAATAARVRHEALELAEQDRSFTPLRAKIHNVPDAGDAAKVREYARTRAPAKLRKRYEKLASDIDDLYASGGAAQTLEDLTAVVTSPALAAPLREAATALRSASGPGPALAAVGSTLVTLREILPRAGGAEERLALLEASLQLEDDAYTLGTSLLAQMQGASRRERLAWLRHTGDALYGVGFLAQRQRDGIRDAVDRIGANTALTVDAYREELRYLARAPEWSSRWLEFNFGTSVTHWRPIEPLAVLFTQDRLRGSPLLFYSRVIDALSLDANRMAGIEHDLFGETVGSGLRALNPGLTRGALVAPEGAEVPEGGFTRDGVYLLPESIADLPRVSGILTRGEGSSLSHLQLLARNLGIPNVVVGEEHVPVVRQRDGDQVVLAVSPLGVVQLVRYGERWEAIFGKERPEQGLVIRPDLEKLDLRPTLIPLSKLRARDSGRLSGPKGANLGELKHHFGDAVPDGFVISFGVFRQVLNQPIEPGGPPVFDWMKQQYARIDGLQGAEKERAISSFLARLRRWIETCDPGRGLRQGLRMALDRLGAEGSFGVFVRSDTNVEDLPGFTGAGLNLTVPNVVGYDNVLAAVKQVWASPFTERAYGWRQSHMEQPEYVFPAVVVQRSFPSEKSGVLVTVDVDSGQPGWLSIAVNEGVGGAVEGQAAESLRVDAASGEVRVLAIATSPRRAELSPRGGVTRVPASGEQAVLQPDEIRQLMQFASTVSRRFPSLRDEDGSPLPADVEFAFRGGRLTLLQIRPFVESRSAQQSNYLSQLDASFRQRGASRVELDAAPREPSG
jgi:phosphohistidine swiveling domain-containing protein